MMAGMVLISFVLLGASFATLSYQYSTTEKKDTLERNASYIALFTTRSLASGANADDSNFRANLEVLARLSDSKVIVTTPDGVVAFATDGRSATLGYEGWQIPETMVDFLLNTGSYAGTSTLGSLLPKNSYVVGMPITTTVAGMEVYQGLVFVSADLSYITSMWRGMATIFLVTAGVVILIACIISSLTSLQQARPLKEMAAAARAFGHGDFSVRVDTGKREDEIGELAEAFNTMADSLAKSEERRSEFIANVSHELKTPMTTIAGFADGILDGTIPPAQQREYLTIISSETRRLSRLVRSMLDLSRMQSTEELTAQERFDISEIMVQVLLSLEGKVNGKGLEVETDLPDEPVMVWGDPDSITQVGYNLLDNAIKFSREGGTLGISVTTRGDKALITVSDQGETIPPEELALIFDRFHKTDRSRSMDRDGVGLGLYIVKTILNTHKENITVESQDGVTRFTFTLTLA